MSPLISLFRKPRGSRLYNIRRKFASRSLIKARIERVLKRLPKFLQPYVINLKEAPVSNIVSFLILHELTAVIPLIGLSLGFHYTGWIPRVRTEAKWVDEGVDKFGRYFKKKEWFGFERVEDVKVKIKKIEDIELHGDIIKGSEEIKNLWDERMSGGKKVLIQVATAYAITKLLLPVRIAFSVWSTPWFTKKILVMSKRFFARN